jgi:hypothetical protein
MATHIRSLLTPAVPTLGVLAAGGRGDSSARLLIQVVDVRRLDAADRIFNSFVARP